MRGRAETVIQPRMGQGRSKKKNATLRVLYGGVDNNLTIS
jgi:hypothetical protein